MLDSMFTVVPHLRESFSNEEAGVRIISAFGRCVNNIHHPQSMKSYLNKLGHRHLKYGLKPQYFDIIREVFMKTFRSILINDFTPEVERGLRLAYGFVKE